jgi:adenine C2-methylase RlmN of 23S rRNA A2503 and tRNA A37
MEKEALPLLQMIRASIETFATKEEQEELIHKGFISKPDMMINFLQDMKSKLEHHCTNNPCTVSVQTTQNDGSMMAKQTHKCKQPDTRRMNPDPTSHSFLKINVNHL